MKIKHKVSGLTLEGHFTYDGTDYRDTGAHGYSLYHNSQWEEVSEWKDVTHQCEWKKHPCGAYEARWINEWYLDHMGCRIEALPHEFRLRKISGLNGKDVFTVERRV